MNKKNINNNLSSDLFLSSIESSLGIEPVINKEGVRSFSKKNINRKLIEPWIENLSLKLEDIIQTDISDTTKEIINSTRDVILKVGKNHLDELLKNSTENQTKPITKEQELVQIATILLEQRPCFQFNDNKLNDFNNTIWSKQVEQNKTIFESAAKLVGRIDTDGISKGTGFFIDSERVITNRHVAQSFMDKKGKFDCSKKATINFNLESKNSTFPIKDILSTPPDWIGKDANFNIYDYAILEVEMNNCCEIKDSFLPSYSKEEELTLSEEVYVIGHPIYNNSRNTDGDGNKYRDYKLLNDFLRTLRGDKFLSPGKISKPVGEVEDDIRETVFFHDCSTLEGSSGSPVMVFNQDMISVYGLHFAGNYKIANAAHVMNRIRKKFN